MDFELLKIENYFFEFSVDKNNILTDTYIMDILDKESVQHAIDYTVEDRTDGNSYDEIKIEHYGAYTKYLQKRGHKFEWKTSFVEDNELTVFNSGNALYVHKGLESSESALRLCRKMYNESVLP